MYKRLKVVIYAIIMLAIILIGCFMFLKMNKFEVSSNDRYIVITGVNRNIRLYSDGGSYTEIYYEIDLSKKIVKKCADRYVGFKGFDYKEKILNKKNLTNQEAQKLKAFFENKSDDYIEDVKIDYQNDDGTFSVPSLKTETDYWTIVSYNRNEVKFSDYKDIERLTNLLE